MDKSKKKDAVKKVRGKGWLWEPSPRICEFNLTA